MHNYTSDPGDSFIISSKIYTYFTIDEPPKLYQQQLGDGQLQVFLTDFCVASNPWYPLA